MAMSHANCTHPRTPAARSACRKSQGTVVTDREALVGTQNLEAREAAIRITGPVARRMARQAVAADNLTASRIQPRRSGARVTPEASTCVQAALHTGRGLCACGNVSGGFIVRAG